MTDPKEKIGVVGAGLMGAEIALVHAMAGHAVLLNDHGDALLAAARAARGPSRQRRARLLAG